MKKFKYKISLVFLVMFLVSAFHCFAAELLFLSDFETGNIQSPASNPDGWAEQACYDYSFEIVPSPVRAGNYAIKVFLSKNDEYLCFDDRRPRAQIYKSDPSATMLTSHVGNWIGYSVFIPDDWPATGKSSLFSYFMTLIHTIDSNGNERIHNRWGAGPGQEPDDTEDVYVDTYSKGVWVDWIIYCYASWESDGVLKVWRNGELVVNKNAPNCIEGMMGWCTPRFKLYKWNWKSTPTDYDELIIYFDEIRMADGPDTQEYYDLVDPAQGGPGIHLPTVTTQSITNITNTTAIGHGIITATGGENATKRGICWNITGSPTVADDNITEQGNFFTGAFSGNMTGLVSGQHYYVKPYAYNTAGYGYGSVVDFTTSYSTGISQAGWSLHYVDSEEVVGESGNATNSFDGDINTFWHTEWDASDPPYPHEIQINLGASYNITGFNYIPRQDESPNGRISQYEFYVSTDGATWGTPASNSTFANDASVKIVNFSSETGQYVRLKGINEVGGNPWASMAELNVLATGLPGINNPSRLYGIQMIGCEIK